MTSHYELEPEVAGRYGDNTIIDTSVHPPIVSKFHFIFDGWLGDSILETFPCFLVTEGLGIALRRKTLSGFHLCDVEVELSEQFAELYPDRTVPQFRWLHVDGIASVNDFGISTENTLIVSSTALKLIREHGCNNCDIADV